MKIQKIFLLILTGLFSNCAIAQTINLDFKNSSLDATGTILTYEIWAAQGTGYNTGVPSMSNWQFINMRTDVQVPAGVTILSAGIVTNPVYSSGGGVATSVPGAPPAGSLEYSVNLTRTSQTEIPPEATGAYIGTVTIVFSASVPGSNTNSVRQFNNATSGAFWTNLDSTVPRKPLSAPVGLPLPVSLIKFEALKEERTAKLQWTTTSESNSDRFEIQQSKTGKQWFKIGIITAKGESASLLTYYFVDKNPVAGENLYRLKMVDTDGTFAYSPIRSLKFEDTAETNVYPNPVSNLIFIKAADVTSVKIVNVSGIPVYQSDKIMDGISVKNLVSGIYLVHVTHASGLITTRKVVISK